MTATRVADHMTHQLLRPRRRGVSAPSTAVDRKANGCGTRPTDQWFLAKAFIARINAEISRRRAIARTLRGSSRPSWPFWIDS